MTTETNTCGRVAWTVATLSNPLVAAHLADAMRETERTWLSSKIIVENYKRGKSRLRPHRDRAGRLYVRAGYKGNGRAYLADKCEITFIDNDPTIFRFYVEGK